MVAFGLAGSTAIYAQAPPAGTAGTPQSRAGQAHIVTNSPKPGERTNDKARDEANSKKAKKPGAPANPGAKEPIRNPANGPVGTPINPK